MNIEKAWRFVTAAVTIYGPCSGGAGSPIFSHSPAAGSESGYAAAVQASTRVIREDPILITPPLRGNRWAALGSNGLPYALSVFHMLGTINVYDLENPFDAIWKLLTVPTDHAGQIPEHGAVVQLQ